MSFKSDERPTQPSGSVPRMSVPQVREALAAFPVDQQPLLHAMLDALWDDGFLVGKANLPRLCPLTHHPASEPPSEERQQRKGRRSR